MTKAKNMFNLSEKSQKKVNAVLKLLNGKHNEAKELLIVKLVSELTQKEHLAFSKYLLTNAILGARNHNELQETVTKFYNGNRKQTQNITEKDLSYLG